MRWRLEHDTMSSKPFLVVPLVLLRSTWKTAKGRITTMRITTGKRATRTGSLTRGVSST